MINCVWFVAFAYLCKGLRCSSPAACVSRLFEGRIDPKNRQWPRVVTENDSIQEVSSFFRSYSLCIIFGRVLNHRLEPISESQVSEFRLRDFKVLVLL